MTPRPPGPVARVRARVERSLGEGAAAALPDGFQRIGRVVVVKLPEELRPQFGAIGEAYRHELRAGTVLRRRGGIAGEFRVPGVERIAGDGTETEVVENGVRYRLDAACLMFAAGNHSERRRVGALVRPGETVVDLFAGIGYLTIPAAVHGRAARVHACEANPVAVEYLAQNVALNGVGDRVTIWPGDNREAPLPAGTADRIFLGLLPDSVAFVPRALELLKAPGGWLHVHRLLGTREPSAEAEAPVRAAVERAERAVEQVHVRRVKPYGPGRDHVVVDLRAGPAPVPRTA